MTWWGLVAISLVAALLYWPSKIRRIDWQLSALAGAVSHEGLGVTTDWLKGLDAGIRSNFSLSTTAVTIEGVINESLSQDRNLKRRHPAGS